MGAQPAKLLPQRVLDQEVGYLRMFRLCSDTLADDLNGDVNIALESLGLVLPPNSYNALSDGRLDSKTTDLIKSALLDRINEFKVSDTLGNRFYDYRLMSVLTCLFGNLWSLNKETFQITSLTKDFFHLSDNLSSGQWGLVFKATRGGSNLSFIIKSQMVTDYAELSIHEAFVGLVALNKMRAFCPNYSCIYGAFMCGKPDAIGGQICTDDIEVPYTVYENIEGPTIHDLIRNYPITKVVSIHKPQIYPLYEDVISCILQMVFALQIGHARAHKFSHRDLHYHNVICRPLKTESSIRYDSKYFIFDDALKSSLGVPQPELESKEGRRIYYVRSRYAATIIDYDTAQLFFPLSQEDGSLTTDVRFGRPEFSEDEEGFAQDPALGKIRDLCKFLGFVTYACLFTKAHDDFKIMMMDLYLDTVMPYRTLYADTAHVEFPDVFPAPRRRLATLDEKLQVIVYDAKNNFSPVRSQLGYIRDGRISYRNFMANLMRLVPQTYLSRIMVEANFTPRLDRDAATMLTLTPELEELDLMVEARMGVPVLKCRENCSNAHDTYNQTMTTDLLKELLQADLLGADNTAYHASRLQKSRTRFARSELALRTRTESGDQIMKYRNYNDLRVQSLLTQEQGSTDGHALVVLSHIEEGIQYIERSLPRISRLPQPEKFFTENLDTDSGIESYRAYLKDIFNVLARVRKIIELNNGLVFLRPELAGRNRAKILEVTQNMILYHQTLLLPWRDKLAGMIAAGKFTKNGIPIGEVMAVFIVSKIPSAITFDPVN